jgi:signal transduction histidine kinase
MRLRYRTGTRIAAAMAVAFVSASSLIGLVAVLVTQTYMLGVLDRHVEAASSSLIADAGAGRPSMLFALDKREQRSGNDIGYALFDASGRRLAGSLDVERPEAGWQDIWFRDPVEGADPGRALSTDLPNGDRLVVAGNRRPLLLVQSTILWLYGLAVIVTTLLCGTLAVALARYIDRKLMPVAQVADAVLQGQFERRVPVAAVRDEFDAVSASLNAMLDRVATLVDDLRQVTGDVAHDLRTPLTNVRAELETARGGSETESRAAIERSLDHLDHALELFAAILRISEVKGSGTRRADRVALDLVAADVCATLQPVFEDMGGSLSWTCDPDSLVSGDEAQLSSMIVNLLENVLRHGGLEPQAIVLVTHDAEQVRLGVRDRGPGVPEGQLTRIFQRFVQLDASRSRGSFGLGLSLVRAIADAHGATLSAHNRAPGLEIALVFQSPEVPRG